MFAQNQNQGVFSQPQNQDMYNQPQSQGMYGQPYNQQYNQSPTRYNGDYSNQSDMSRMCQPCAVCYDGCAFTCKNCYSGCKLLCSCCSSVCAVCAVVCGFMYAECMLPLCRPFKECCDQCCVQMVKAFCDGESCMEKICKCQFTVTNPFLIKNESNVEVTQLLDEFDQLGPIYSTIYKDDAELLEHRVTKELIVLKILDVSEMSESLRQVREYNSRLNLRHLHIIQLRFFCQKQIEQFFHTQYRAFLLLDYVSTDLEVETLARKDKMLKFTESELLGIILAVLSSLLYLHQKGINPLDVWLSAKHLYITPNGVFKISDPQLLGDGLSPLQEAKKQFLGSKSFFSYLRSVRPYYLAPEQIDEIIGIGNSQQNSPLFTLGMIILETVNQDDISNIYATNIADGIDSGISSADIIDFQGVDRLLLDLKRSYSNAFTSFIGKLLTKNFQDRPSMISSYKELLSFDLTQELMSQLDVTDKPWRRRYDEYLLEVDEIQTKRYQKDSTHQIIQTRVLDLNNDSAGSASKYNLQSILKNKGYKSQTESKQYDGQRYLDGQRNGSSQFENQKQYEDPPNAFQQILQSKNYEFAFKKRPVKVSLGIVEMPRPAYVNVSQMQNQQQQYQQQQQYTQSQIPPPPLSETQKQTTDDYEFVTESYPNGSSYQGYKLRSKRHGHGIYKHPSGSHYDGEWRKGMMSGYGKFLSGGGQLIYEGEWSHDEFDGRGVEFNDLVQDKISNNQYHNQEDCLNFSDMNELQHLWVKYEGQFEDDMKHGKGRMTFKNGDIFEGNFLNGQISGPGVFIFKDKQIRGNWVKGKLVSSNLNQ